MPRGGKRIGAGRHHDERLGKRISLRLPADLVEWYDHQDNKSEVIFNLIRQQIAKELIGIKLPV